MGWIMGLLMEQERAGVVWILKGLEAVQPISVMQSRCEWRSEGAA